MGMHTCHLCEWVVIGSAKSCTTMGIGLLAGQLIGLNLNLILKFGKLYRITSLAICKQPKEIERKVKQNMPGHKKNPLLELACMYTELKNS